MKVLNIYDPQNTFVRTVLPAGSGWFKKDGNEFKRQAKLAAEHYADKHNAIVEMYAIKGKTAREKRQNLLEYLRMAKPRKFDRINFFCHGHPKALNRNMFRMLPTKFNNLPLLAKRLKPIAAYDCKIVLYSCKTAKLDNGFASALCNKLDLEVLGHTTSGHTTRNPYKRIALGNDNYWGKMILKKLWPDFGGIRALKKQLRRSKFAPFEFVEKVFGGE